MDVFSREVKRDEGTRAASGGRRFRPTSGENFARLLKRGLSYLGERLYRGLPKRWAEF